MPEKPQRRLLSIERTAEILDVSTRTVRRYIADGLLPGYRMGGRLLRVDADDVDKLLRRVPAAGGSGGAR